MPRVDTVKPRYATQPAKGRTLGDRFHPPVAVGPGTSFQTAATVSTVDVVLTRSGRQVELTWLDASYVPTSNQHVSLDKLTGVVADVERLSPRWVWADTSSLYPLVLQGGTRVRRCVDLGLCHTILHRAVPTASPATEPDVWGQLAAADLNRDPTLLDDLASPADLAAATAIAEHQWQQRVLAQSDRPGRLRLLLAAESAGSLMAAEMRHDGMPWNAAVHDEQLVALLGPRPRSGGRPAVLEQLAAEVRSALSSPKLNPDSATELLRALTAAGIDCRTTRQWELERINHPAIPPLLRYKKLSRLLSANGWTWLDAWVHRGRFHPDYVPGGVVTGRWATRGGGALQLPRQIRAAVQADPGWKLVVADAAQLEPRVLAAMARDERMAEAGRGVDLYQGLVDAGIVDTRAHAKVAMLGALYGATSGEAGQLMPRLLRAYPKATGLVEEAARTGEGGGTVTTWLGRTSPLPPDSWQQVQQLASQPDAGPAEDRRARRAAREWGRFTRNFVVQGSAAEWALCWLAQLRNQLTTLETVDSDLPELVYFLHDEVIVHTPASLADDVAGVIRTAADQAGELLFGTFPVEFALSISIVDNYAEAN